MPDQLPANIPLLSGLEEKRTFLTEHERLSSALLFSTASIPAAELSFALFGLHGQTLINELFCAWLAAALAGALFATKFRPAPNARSPRMQAASNGMRVALLSHVILAFLLAIVSLTGATPTIAGSAIGTLVCVLIVGILLTGPITFTTGAITGYIFYRLREPRRTVQLLGCGDAHGVNKN